MSNSFSTLGKAAVNSARKNGIKAGLLKLRLLRPFPESDIVKAIKGAKAVAVVDQNISVGKGVSSIQKSPAPYVIRRISLFCFPLLVDSEGKYKPSGICVYH